MRALLLFAALAAPAAAQRAPQVGDHFELIRSYKQESRTCDTGSSSARGSDALDERVISVGPDGTELAYDLPADADAAARARTWQFPARARRSADGTLQLLNAGELEQRLERWLAAAKWDRSTCGKLIFTWNAFRIECDPQSVLAEIGSFDLSGTVAAAGARYSDPDALAPAVLTAGADRRSFVATLQPDPAKVRRSRAETDVAVAEILQKPVSLDAALAAHAGERVSGEIVVTLHTGADGLVERRTRVTTLAIVTADGTVEWSTDTRTVERRRLPPPATGPVT